MQLETILNTPNVNIRKKKFNFTEIDSYELIILIVEDFNNNEFLASLDSLELKSRFKKSGNQHNSDYLTQIPNSSGTYFLALKKSIPFTFMDKLKNKLKKIDNLKGNIAIVNQSNKSDIAQYALRTTLALSANLPQYKKESNSHLIKNIELFNGGSKSLINEVIAGHKGNFLARSLSILPTNYLTPQKYLKIIKEICKQYKLSLEVYNYQTLKNMGANAFCAVGRACQDESFIICVKRRVGDVKNKVTFVGKGICFDTGGVSLKDPTGMYGMHEDMQGSSVALGSLLAISDADYPINVDCYLAITQNLIGSESYLVNEVITALNGTTIEVTDTDAEGRMALSDTLTLASKEKSDLLIDYATLTGSAVRAVSTRYTALFTPNIDRIGHLVHLGNESGERVWPLPMSDDFDQLLSSEIADTLQCCVTSSPDHILAARFLHKFIDHNNVKEWWHLDLASAENKGGLGAIPTNTTGNGVFFTMAAIKSQFKL
ncbi:peptidase M17 [Paraphotobacterium marinum]|uniref:Peptidase M17 n=1 Tax=Paraphotobacterium marinum TaxID=1755811 RepID=A0A220VHN8_9GAMM|nr:M17 family metallopeptidase [Paraphotobacterium marinum]ASK79702.1 peptidase M17 [Paraphotobacterium marinum]